MTITLAKGKISTPFTLNMLQNNKKLFAYKCLYNWLSSALIVLSKSLKETMKASNNMLSKQVYDVNQAKRNSMQQ